MLRPLIRGPIYRAVSPHSVFKMAAAKAQPSYFKVSIVTLGWLVLLGPSPQLA